MAINYPLIAPNLPSRTAKMGALNATGLVQSPFTLQQQAQQWDGEMWTLQIGLPPYLLRANAEQWITMLAALRGRYGTFLYGPRWAKTPQGVATGTPLAKGAAQTGIQLATRNWTPNVTGILKAGDFFQLCKNYVFSPINLADPSWVPTTLTVTANAIAAPDGTTTATKLVANGGATNAMIWQVMDGSHGALPPLIVSRQFACGVWLKVPSGTQSLPLYISDGVNNLGSTNFTLTTSWQLFTFTNRALTDPAATVMRFQIGGNSLWTAGIEVHAWGAFFYSPTLDAHLHKVLTDANSDANGNATFDIFPRLREASTDFAPLITSSPVGTWRLAANQREWSIDQALTYGIDFQAVEAL